MDSLREKVADMIDGYRYLADGEASLAIARADKILAIPEIKEALELKAAHDGKVGYERQG